MPFESEHGSKEGDAAFLERLRGASGAEVATTSKHAPTLKQLRKGQLAEQDVIKVMMLSQVLNLCWTSGLIDRGMIRAQLFSVSWPRGQVA